MLRIVASLIFVPAACVTGALLAYSVFATFGFDLHNAYIDFAAGGVAVAWGKEAIATIWGQP